MKSPFLLLLSFIVSLQSFAQNDTTYIYLDGSEHICDKDTAKLVKLFYKQGDTWYSEKYSTTTRYILEETTFSEDSGNIKQIIEHKEFNGNGILYKRLIFVRGVMKSGFYYYPNGAIQGTADFNTLGEIVKQSGYDENGGEIRNYYFEKKPELVGGDNFWRLHVYKNIQRGLIRRNKAPNGQYKLKLNFYVNVDGSVSDVTVDKDPGFGIKEEALRLFHNAAKWYPGYINGKKVRMNTHLVVVFTLDDTMLDY